VKEAGFDFVIMQAGYGKFSHQKDTFFEHYYVSAKAAGLGVGAYHYSYAVSIDDARREAEVFAEWIKGKQFDYPVALDIEENVQAKLSTQQVGDIVSTFCENMEDRGYYVSVYSYASFLNNKIPEAVRSKYDIWVAHFDVDKPAYNGTYGMWQYTARGRVNGINGDVDCDYAYKDYPDIIINAGLNGYEKPVEPDAPVQPEPPKKFPKGDLNEDGVVDIEDLVMLNNHINGIKPLE
jgi:GH25 family lysozyme M1 (1,4-beta-N-acetylmuramidase)